MDSSTIVSTSKLQRSLILEKSTRCGKWNRLVTCQFLFFSSLIPFALLVYMEPSYNRMLNSTGWRVRYYFRRPGHTEKFGSGYEWGFPHPPTCLSNMILFSGIKLFLDHHLIPLCFRNWIGKFLCLTKLTQRLDWFHKSPFIGLL